MAVLEICANSIHSAINAEDGGAHRIELCQNLEAGGITPSVGLITRVKQRSKLEVHVLIRPRTGNFCYSDDEFKIMLEDIRACKALACEGIVIGMLTTSGSIDVPQLTRLVRAAKPMSVTFHRAFDDCKDQFQALEDVIKAGCDRVLTSGQAGTAVAGSARIVQLIEHANRRIVIMPGAGITAENLSDLIDATGATEYHASAKMSIPAAGLGRFDTLQLQTDLNQVQALVKILLDASGSC